MKIKILTLIFLGIVGFAFAQEPITEFSDETLPILNQQLKELRETPAAELRDKDGDTKIQVEESADEDKIRFDTEGTERLSIDSTGMVGMIIENRTSDPASPITGQVWFRTDL